MDIIAAFRWESSKEKSLSYMMIDGDFQKRVEPKSVTLNRLNFELFQNEATEFIKDFYNQIEMLYLQNKKDCSILIEYKIVGSGSPVSPFQTKMHKPSDQTEFIRILFHKYFQKVADKMNSIQLASQYRTKLKKPFLDQFKQDLEDCELVENKKGKAYEQHLWALALHATKTTFPKKIKKLRDNMLRQEKEIETKQGKRHLSEN